MYQALSQLEDAFLSTPAENLGFGAAAAAKGNNAIPDTDGDGNVDYPEARLEIEEGCHQLETLITSTLDKNFDKFEIYVLRNLLAVPEGLEGWIRLGHYEVRLRCFHDWISCRSRCSPMRCRHSKSVLMVSTSCESTESLFYSIPRCPNA